MSSWHSYPKIYAIGHRGIKDLLLDPVLVEEKVDGCVSPDSMILKEDLSYIRAGDLIVGDKLLAFEDTLNNPRLIESTVTHSKPIIKECVSVHFGNDGKIIKASIDHPFLIRQKTNNNGKIWVKAKDLRPGMRIVSLPVWSRDTTWDGGYIAAFFDGEGSLVRSRNQRVLSVYQRTGPTLDHLIWLLGKNGFNFNLDIRRRREDWADVGSLVLRGGTWTEILRFLGIYRPVRLLADSKKIWNNTVLNYVGDTEVIGISPIGLQVVQGLSTTSKTYIADGLFSHNSQFSFGKFIGDDGDEFIRCRSKGCELNVECPDKMFQRAVDVVKTIQHKLHLGWTYRGEYLAKPKHNALAYDRNPLGHIIIFDINTEEEAYLSHEEKRAEADRIGLETVPVIYFGIVENIELFRSLLERASILGGQKIEGVVVKNYNRFGQDKKALMGKFVSEAFKEVHRCEWKESNPTTGDIIQRIIEQYRSPTRWAKALQHVRESVGVTDSPKDIGLIMREVPSDILAECGEDIKDKLFEYAWKHISRGVVHGLPEWYKEELLKKQFEKEKI